MWEERSRMDLLEEAIDKTEDGRLLHAGGTVNAAVRRRERALAHSSLSLHFFTSHSLSTY